MTQMEKEVSSCTSCFRTMDRDNTTLKAFSSSWHFVSSQGPQQSHNSMAPDLLL